MVKKRQHHLLLLLLLQAVTPAQAQHGISPDVQAWANIRLATTYSGWDAGRNGGGISVGINKLLEKALQAEAGGELGAAGIGNYLAAKAGIARPINLGSSRWVYNPGIHILQGMTLSRPHPLYMWGFEQSNTIGYRLKNSSGPGLVIGFRFYGFPGYSEFSSVNTFLDLKIGVRYSF